MNDLIRHSNNQIIALTKEIANSGEGKVWETNLDGYLAKIYHDPTPARIAKLKVMLANPPADPMLSHNHVSIAWVSDLLKDSNGKYVGFLMPAIANSKPLSSVCNPKLRKRNAEGFNWYYLHVTALNTAWIVRAIHAKGYVLGDIKLENILVNDRAMIAVIDTDSFQVRDTSAKKVYLCTVGSEGFTPPELIGKDFHKVKQSQNQDCFRLGVLIHYLLFGYHPFSGSWTGVGECPEQTELIRQGYWYGGHNSPIRASAATIPLDVVHPKLKKLFLQCFNDGHEQSHLRPSAEDWHNALETAVNDLTACNRIDNHHYSKHYGKCYWCDRADKLGVDIFPGVEKIPQKNRSQTIVETKKSFFPKESNKISDTADLTNIRKTYRRQLFCSSLFEVFCDSLIMGFIAYVLLFIILVLYSLIIWLCSFTQSLNFSYWIVMLVLWSFTYYGSIAFANLYFVFTSSGIYDMNRIIFCSLTLIYQFITTYIYYKTSIFVWNFFNIENKTLINFLTFGGLFLFFILDLLLIFFSDEFKEVNWENS